MTEQSLNHRARQVWVSRPLTLALPCAALAFSAIVVAVSARAPHGPKCFESALVAPGFDSLAPQVRAACIRIRF